MAPFIPARVDIQRTRAYLHHRLGLPNELVLTILDEARYWVERTGDCSDHVALLDSEWSTTSSSYAYPYLGMPAFPSGSLSTLIGETPKIKEIEFLVVSHDQGWTTEGSAGTFDTSSWTEVSILRSTSTMWESGVAHGHMQAAFEQATTPSRNIYSATERWFSDSTYGLVPRPSLESEPQRLHCAEMRDVTYDQDEVLPGRHNTTTKEGDHAWYLQGNEVARGNLVFEGEMVRRHRIVWGSTRQIGNEGAGSGTGFIESLQPRDWICVWSRAKRRGWENHVHGIRVTIRYNIL
ncbi:hypothetical protein ACN47E_003401 [Coniothyrium glycines]